MDTLMTCWCNRCFHSFSGPNLGLQPPMFFFRNIWLANPPSIPPLLTLVFRDELFGEVLFLFVVIGIFNLIMAVLLGSSWRS